jgi:long-chain fatty acid transport protein
LILGARYSLNDSVALSAGYLYGETPVPDETFSPSIPDADTHLITLGAGINYRQFKIDLAYGYQVMESRRKNNDVDDDPATPLDITTSANGVYDTTLHLLGFSFTYTF